MTLAPDVTALIRLSGAVASGDSLALEESLEQARRDADPVQIEEAILQSYLFLGYPTALNALAQWRALAAGPASDPVEDDWSGWADRGREVCRTVYGGQYDRLRENVRALHPDLERWMVTEGYGKVLGRPGLPLQVRELCIVGLLAVTGAATQLYSHLRGALNAGADARAVQEALEVVDIFLEDRSRRVARDTWARVLGRTR